MQIESSKDLAKCAAIPKIAELPMNVLSSKTVATISEKNLQTFEVIP